MLAVVDRVAFEFFGIAIYWYAIIIVTGVIIAMFLSSREAVRVGLKADDVTDFMLVGLPVALIGARLYYVLFDLPTYLNDPLQIFNVRSGGLAIYGGLIAGGIWLVIFCRHHFIPIWKFLDIAAPSIILAQGIGRWGNFMNHEAYGAITTKDFLQNLHLPQFIIDNMYIEGHFRQPTFLYESVWNVLGFLILIILRNKNVFKEGEVFLSYIIWYSLGRFFIEGMRSDSLYLFGSIRISQALSFILFFSAWGILIYRRKNNQKLKDYDRSHGSNRFLI